jgi:hypothetical protein
MLARLLFALSLVAASAHGATDDADRAACRAAHPGGGAAVAKAYMDCLAERDAAKVRTLEAADAMRQVALAAEIKTQQEREASERAASEQRAAAELSAQAEREAAAKAEADRVAAAEQVREDALRQKCGKDFGRVRRGMRWGPRLQECAGPFVLVSEGVTGSIYEAPGGLVRVRGGKVAAWTAR